VLYLLDGVSRCWRNPQLLLPDRDGGVVDALDVDHVVDEERIGCAFGERCITNEHVDDVRRPGTTE